MSSRLYGQNPSSKAELVIVANQNNGGLYISDTAAHAGNFGAFIAHTLAVGSFTSSNIRGVTTSVTVPAGGTFYGQFSSITLASGTGVAYDSVTQP